MMGHPRKGAKTHQGYRRLASRNEVRTASAGTTPPTRAPLGEALYDKHFWLTKVLHNIVGKPFVIHNKQCSISF